MADSGRFNVLTTSPWAGYAIPNGLWLAGDFNGDRKTDIVHAVQKNKIIWQTGGLGKVDEGGGGTIAMSS